MIRVNLLPVRKSRRRSQGRIQLILFAGIIVLEVALLAAVYITLSAQKTDYEDQLAELQEEEQRLGEKESELEDYIARGEEKFERLQTINELQQEQVGPVQMFDELHVLASPIGQGADLIGTDYPGYWSDWQGDDWEPRRVWIEEFAEQEENQFVLEGRAETGEDVSQFHRRVNTSRFFDAVGLEYVRSEGEELVSFELRGQFDYTGFDQPDDES